MNDVLVERFFAVSVEFTDGRSGQLKVRGESPAEAFKDVRARADVRRVGKVVPIDEQAFHSDRPTAAAKVVRPSPVSPSKSPAGNSPVEPSFDGGTSRESHMGFTISGPRVVRDAKRLGYEQPFKNLRARPGSVSVEPQPEPSKPVFSPFGPAKGPTANDSSRPSVFAKPVAEQPAAEETADTSSTDAVTREYRIVRSRRQSGEPFLLQRGIWAQVKGKRVFEVEWEKGFDTREKAEKQQAWLGQMVQEASELDD